MIGSRTLLALCLFVSLPFTSATARAADIKLERDHDSGVTLITVVGEFGEDDGQRFAAVAARVPPKAPAWVVFASPGGRLIAGLQMGKVIEVRHFVTIVPPQTICASACALAWLAGAPRVMARGARIGFHAARSEDGEVSGVGNAWVGAYLDQLGLSMTAIMYVEKADPSAITWLSEGDARQIGLEVRVVSFPRSAGGDRPTRQAPGSGARPAIRLLPDLTGPLTPSDLPARPSSLEDAAKNFAGEYFSHWSEDNTQALSFFGAAYAPQVNFYGGTVERSILMAEKRDYTSRWPVRVYSARRETLRTFCNPSNRTCAVSGVVDWDCRSPARNARSTGSANFILTLRIVGEEPEIVAEAGSVIARQAD